MSNPWFRMYAEFSHDPKIQMLSEAMQRRYVMLMCMRCEDVSGYLTNETVAFHLRISLQDAEDTMAELCAAGFIDGAWGLCNQAGKEAERPPSHIWNLIRSRIFKRDDYTCQYCGERGKRLECDHVIPVARGGHHEDSNLVAACFACNRSKHDKLVREWRPA